MDEHAVSAVPVLDPNDRVIGVVSQADLLAKQKSQDPFTSRSPLARLRRYLAADRVRATTAGGLMSTPAYTIGPEATVVDAAKLLDSKGAKRLPVVDESGGLVGIVSRRDPLPPGGRLGIYGFGAIPGGAALSKRCRRGRRPAVGVPAVG